MAIRITGMYSGLDTESIIGELASAQSVKKNKLVKAQTKLSWKQDAWKALNTKIYSFYTNILDNMRFEGSYMRKSTKVSHPNAVSIVTSADAPNSVQTLKIGQLAKQGYLTGGKLAAIKDKDGNDVKVSATTKLKDMGFSGEGSFRVKVNGRSTDITLKEDMKISDVVNQLNAAGLSASFDAKNQRFYINAKNSGATADFTITSNDAGGKDILGKLGLVAAYDTTSNEYKEYQLWASYRNDLTARGDAEAKEIAKLIAAKKASTDSLLKANEEYQKRLDALFKDNDENSKYQIDYDENDKEKVNKQADALYEELYGPETPKLDKDGKPVLDDDGKPVMERVGGLKKTLDDAKDALKKAQEELAELKKNNTATEADIELAEKAVTEASEKVTDAQKAFNEKNAHYSYVKGVANIQNAIEANKETIADNRSYYEVDPATGEPVLDADGKLQATQKAKDEIADYFDDKIAMAEQYLKDAADYENLSDAEKEALGLATKIDGRDATINLNGVEYTSSKNTFEINGMTITVQQEISEEITLTTAEDTDEIFNMIKNFFTEYNKLINEMDGLYNADSSKGYEPLLSEEKQG
ncbi:MAG: flagellar filament capping protein FliD, partial [Lachnospiraceae bacterium]|nr:flagellar filament capping protein FliD [Lachnospiraceae bacterium]